MTTGDIATSNVTARSRSAWFRFDSSQAILYVFAAVLCVLVIMPMTWLAIYAFTDRTRSFTLANFQRLFTEADFIAPLMTTFTIAVSSSIVCCCVAAPMGWLVARTNLPFSRTIRALVTASFVTPPFLGAIAWELLAAPNSGLLNKLYRFVTGAPQDEYLLNIYSMAGLIFVISCYTFPYVFVLIANSLDRMPGDLEDASSILGGKTWVTARKITIPLALPALLAGAIVAFLQATTLFGSPAILALPAGFHTMTTKIWSLFQYPPKPELAAAASLPLLLITIMLLRAEHAILGRRGYSVVGGKQSAPRLVPLGRLKWVAFAGCMGVLLLPVILPYGALINAAFAPIATTPLTFANATLRNFNFVFFELSATKPVLQNTFILGTLAATIGTVIALVIAYLTSRKAVRGWRVLGFLATAPIAIPGIVLGVGLFLSYTRPPFQLYGTLWVLLLAYITIELPAAYQQMQSAFRAVHPELEEASRILGASRLKALWQITAPIAIPGIVLGVGLFLSYTRPPFQLYGTLWVLLLAYITIELPAAYQQMQSAFRAVHPELEEASRILGASRLKALWQITAPLLRTSVLATWCFIFVSVIRELSAAVILFTSRTKVVSVLIFDLKESGDLGAIAVLGLLMLLLTFIVIIFINRIPGFGSGTRLRNN